MTSKENGEDNFNNLFDDYFTLFKSKFGRILPEISIHFCFRSKINGLLPLKNETTND